MGPVERNYLCFVLLTFLRQGASVVADLFGNSIVALWYVWAANSFMTVTVNSVFEFFVNLTPPVIGTVVSFKTRWR